MDRNIKDFLNGEEADYMRVKIRISYDTFRGLRESGGYYVDKTEVIRDYLEDHFEKAVLFCRPRRFGKSMTMTMLRDFLDIRQDSEGIFKGLKIMGYSDVVRDYMNQYPVVFLSLKDVFGQNFRSVFRNFQNIISTVCKENAELLTSVKVDPADKELLDNLSFRIGTEEDMVEALSLLARMLHDHYEKPVFVLVDEYDAPIAKAQGTPFYDQVRDMIELMLSQVCKTNENMMAVVLSGCLYTVKTSSYTGVNNIIPYTVLSPIFSSAIGFLVRM